MKKHAVIIDKELCVIVAIPILLLAQLELGIDFFLALVAKKYGFDDYTIKRYYDQYSALIENSRQYIDIRPERTAYVYHEREKIAFKRIVVQYV